MTSPPTRMLWPLNGLTSMPVDHPLQPGSRSGSQRGLSVWACRQAEPDTSNRQKTTINAIWEPKDRERRLPSLAGGRVNNMAGSAPCLGDTTGHSYGIQTAKAAEPCCTLRRGSEPTEPTGPQSASYSW